MTVLLFLSATHVQRSVQSLSQFDKSSTASGSQQTSRRHEADETTIVDVDGPARIIDPQDDVRLARHHRYGCSFDDVVCAYKTWCLYMSGTGSWCKSLTSEICAMLFMSEDLADFCIVI